MSKVIVAGSKFDITPKMERAVERAFEMYDNDEQIRVPQRDHLGAEFRRGVSCDHRWRPMPLEDDVVVWFRKTLEESAIERGSYCSACGAICLREDGAPAIWAYDATARFFGQVPKERKNDQPPRRTRR